MSNVKDRYLRLPYTRRVRREEDASGGYFVAWIEELQGVEADGDTALEALDYVQAALSDYIDAMLEWGEEIPEPEPWPERFPGERPTEVDVEDRTTSSEAASSELGTREQVESGERLEPAGAAA